VPVVKAPFEIPPAPIADKDIKTTLTTDVVVIGAGCAGLFAALAAAQSGAKVIEIEKGATYSGRGGDNTAIDTKIHKALGIQIDKDRIVRELMHWGGGRLDESLLYLWANNSGKVMDMITDMMAAEGLKNYLVIPDRGDEETAYVDKWPIPTGFPANYNYLSETVVENPTCFRPGKLSRDQMGWLGIVEKNVKKAAAEIRYKTTAKQLVREANNGRVSAVIAQDADGNYIRLNASKAVIVCTGDYGANKEMVAKYGSLLPGSLASSMGEGHQMAMWVGGVMENPPHSPMSHAWSSVGQDAFLYVNKYGKRYYNEDSNPEAIANQAYEQGGFWVVVDDSWTEDVEKMGLGFFKIWKATATVKKEFDAKVTAGTMLKADTLDDLAVKMKVPADALKATVARYNELCKGGKDLDFAKRADRLTPIDKPPYYAGWTAKPASALVVLGGLLVNEKLQTLDAQGAVIPGLYLAGNTVGRRFKSGYPVICPGLSHSMAWTHGYLAGKFATGGTV
jgi:fumarate reductase flavoprotein subunit